MKKSARILSMAAAAALAASMLTACQSKEKETYFEENSAGEIVDSTLLEKIEQESQPLNTAIGDYKQYTRSCGRNSEITMSDKYAYIFWFMGDMGYIKVDLQTGEAIPLCDVAGCTHDYDQFPECINNSFWQNPTPVGDSIWRTEENKLIEETKDGETKVLYENSYCNEFEKATFTEYKNEMYYIFDLLVDDNYAYLFGGAHVTLLDRNTLDEVKTIDLTADTRIYSYDIYDGKIYFVDDLSELYVVDIESSECTKMADHVGSVNVQDGIMYYTENADGVYELYSADLDLNNKKKILECEGIYLGDCVINDGKMIYIPQSEDNTIVCRDIESGEETQIYESESAVLFTGYADFSDRIFFCTESVPDKETLEPYNLLISIRVDGSDLWVKRFDGETWKN